ncbi:MAG: hypothetical protein N2647_03920 [Thermodesulfovibrio sp.]|nr:hypothetical protein [Thermodesulfovibrio sp.]
MIKPKYLVISFIILSLITISFVHSFAENKKSVILYFFWGEGCPYCEKQKEYLKSLKNKYPQLEIKDYEVWHNQAPRELLITMSKAYGINPNGIPVTFIGDKSFIGFNHDIATKIEQTLKLCLKNKCEDPLYKK